MTERFRRPVCTICRHRGRPCAPGLALLEQLRCALAAADQATPPDFALSGAAELDCDGDACPLAFLLSKRGVYVFGDIEDSDAAENLAAYVDGRASLGSAEPAAICVARQAE